MIKVLTKIEHNTDKPSVFHSWWINLIQQHTTWEAVIKEVESCGGKIDDYTMTRLSFKNEKDYLLFLIKWS